jgi:hypothetical protein
MENIQNAQTTLQQEPFDSQHSARNIIDKGFGVSTMYEHGRTKHFRILFGHRISSMFNYLLRHSNRKGNTERTPG